MKKIKIIKKQFFKKLFIKICRLIGFEIIDQNNFNFQFQKILMII